MAKFHKILLLLLIVGGAVNSIHARAAPKPNPDDDDWDWDNDEEETDAEPDHDADHAHSDISSNAKSIPDADTGAKAVGSSGSNIANFNESCDSRTCNSFTNLRCDKTSYPSKCVCADDHTYVRAQEKCYPIWRKEKPSCEFDAQCHAGPAGSLSRCDHVKGVCNCYDTEQSGKREVVRYGDVCVVKKGLGEWCRYDAECQAAMSHNSYCSPKDSSAPAHWNNATETCACKPGYVWDNLLAECLPIAPKGLNSVCKSSIQCTSGPMGLLSECAQESRKCKCFDAKNPGDDNVRYYDKTGVCYERKEYGMGCYAHDECRASISSKAECLPKAPEVGGGPVGDMLLTCQCPRGKTCPRDADGGAGSFDSGSFGLLVAAALLAKMYRV